MNNIQKNFRKEAKRSIGNLLSRLEERSVAGKELNKKFKILYDCWIADPSLADSFVEKDMYNIQNFTDWCETVGPMILHYDYDDTDDIDFNM